jgi:hypothetical protein
MRRPLFEVGQTFVARIQQAVVREHAAQMSYVSSRAATSSPSWLSAISPLGSPASRVRTLGERFQLKMLSGRSTAQRISTIVPMAAGVRCVIDHEGGEVVA